MTMKPIKSLKSKMTKKSIMSLEDIMIKYEKTVCSGSGDIMRLIWGNSGANPCVEDATKNMSVQKNKHSPKDESFEPSSGYAHTLVDD